MSQPQTPNNSGPRCKCGESRPEVMVGRRMCYECSRARMMRADTHARICDRYTEGHHPFGRNIPAFADRVVDIPGNWHRAFDARRADRPEILKRPGDNPLHQIAAIVVTLGETADAAADYARQKGWPEWVANLGNLFAQAAHSAADWLLILAGKLDDRFGPAWVDTLDMPPLWQS